MLRILAAEIRRLRRDESGVALMLTLSVFLLLFVVCAGVYSFGETVRQKVELQNACDSAAYSTALVQADGLSRMAMVNRALSWTYIQLTNLQIDYITYQWLKLVKKRFEEDCTMCGNENRANIGCRLIFVPPAPPPHRCNNSHFNDEGIGWFCGAAGKGMRMVKINGDKLVSIDEIGRILDQFGQIDGYLETIQDMKDQIENFNQALRSISLKMHQSMAQTVSVVLAENLPRNEKGEIDKQLASDFLFYQSVPFPMTENASSPYDIQDEESGLAPGLGYFSALLNNERDERIFLTMADGEVYDTLLEYFPVDYESNDFVAGGLDQWFVRTYSEELFKDEASFSPFETPKTVTKTYMDAGICRAYKNANRANDYQTVYRGHHHSLKDDTEPSCLNRHDTNPEQCQAAPDSVGLVADYEWSSGRYSYQCYHIHTPKPSGGYNCQHFHVYGTSFLSTCTAGHRCNCSGNSHPRSRYQSCVAHGKDLTIPPTSFRWPFPYPVGTSLLLPLNLPCSGGFNLGIGGTQLPTIERDWTLTEWIVRLSNVVEPNGFARIYGDDEELLRDDEMRLWQYIKEKYSNNNEWKKYEGSRLSSYVGTPAQPWILNSTFYGKEGATIVGIARKQRNPFVFLFNAISDVISDDKVDEDGIYSAFNPVDGGYIVAFSSARAAHRFNPSKYAEQWVSANLGHRDVPALIHSGEGEYEARYDAVCDDNSGGNKDWGDGIGRFSIQNTNSLLKNLRIGCVCNDKQNASRFARCWNLCETDWDATLLPLRFAWADKREDTDWYDSFGFALSDSRPVGGVVWENVGTESRSDLDPLEYAAADLNGWAKLFNTSGDLLVVMEDGEIPADFKVPEYFMYMKAPFAVQSEGVRTVATPYSSIEIENAKKANAGFLDLSTLYNIRIL